MKELIEKVNAGEITLDQMVALLAAISEVKLEQEKERERYK